MTDSTESIGGFFRNLLPHLNKERRAEVESMLELLEMFPGQSPTSIAHSISSLLAGARTTVAAMIRRAQALVRPVSDVLQAHPECSADSSAAFLKDAAKLDAKDLQAICGVIQLPAPKRKTAIVNELRLWLEAKGAYAPPSPLEKMKERARHLAGDLPARMGHMTAELAAEVVRTAEAAAKDKELGAEGFAEFAALLLGSPAKGSRPALLKQIKARVDRLAGSFAQTSP